MKIALRALAVGAMLIAALVTAEAQTTQNGPYYATPSWDQQLQCDTQATCPRFVVLANWGNAAVLDRETGLVWQLTPQIRGNNRDFGDAVFNCYETNTGGRSGWRLPTPEELMSLVDHSQRSPALPAGSPFQQVDSNVFWTATTVLPPTLTTPGLAVLISFDLGSVGSGRTDLLFGVWCVRGGSHALTDFVGQG